MAFVAGAIVGNLLLNTSGFTGGIAGAVAAATSGAPGIAGPILAALNAIEETGTRVAHVLADVVKEAGRAFDNMGEQAEKAGVSVEFLSTVGRVAADSGASVDAVADSFKFLNRNIAEALQGNQDAIDSFARVGLSVDDLRGHKPEETWLRVGDAIKDFDNQAQKTQSSMDLLGRGGNELIPTFNMGSQKIREMAGEIRQLGGGVSEAQAKMGDSFGRMETLFGAAMDGIKREASQPVLAFLANHADQVSAGLHTASDTIRSAIRSVWDELKKLEPDVKSFLGSVGPDLKNMVKDLWREFQTSLPDIIALTRTLLEVTRLLVGELHRAETIATALFDTSAFGLLRGRDGHAGIGAVPGQIFDLSLPGTVGNLQKWADRHASEARSATVGKGL
jgi:TP901 family phage tail tape measure protein